MAKRQLTITYDQETDIMEIAIGPPRAAITKEVLPDLFVRYDLATFDDENNRGKDIIGFSIANLSLWKEDDLEVLDRMFPSGVLKDILLWAKDKLVGKQLELVTS